VQRDSYNRPDIKVATSNDVRTTSSSTRLATVPGHRLIGKLGLTVDKTRASLVPEDGTLFLFKKIIRTRCERNAVCPPYIKHPAGPCNSIRIDRNGLAGTRASGERRGRARGLESSSEVLERLVDGDESADEADDSVMLDKALSG
jgi:hypothetical protein